MELIGKHKKFIVLFLGALIADSVLWLFVLFPAPAGEPELYFLDVGQGDSQLIVFPSAGGRRVKMLMDGGPANGALLRQLAQILPLQDRSIDLVLMTHPQLDHFGGFIDLLKTYRVGAFIGTGRKGTTKAYEELEREIARRGVVYVQVRAGDAITYGNSTFAIVSPDKQDIADKELNESSLVVLFKTEKLRALYTGDIGAKTEKKLAARTDLSAQVLKVPHHGSKFSSSQAFVSAVHPQAAVIGVGKNSYGHPTAQTLERLAGAGAEVFRTDRDGTVKITVKDENLLMFKQK